MSNYNQPIWQSSIAVYPTARATVRLMRWVGLGASLTGLVTADANAVVITTDEGREYTIPYRGVAHIAWEKSGDTD